MRYLKRYNEVKINEQEYYSINESILMEVLMLESSVVYSTKLRTALRKISNDISKGFLPEHKLLLSLLIKKLDQKGFEKKQSCAYSIDFIYDSLPVKEKRKILLKFLFSTSSRNRDRA